MGHSDFLPGALLLIAICEPFGVGMCLDQEMLGAGRE